MPSRKQLTAGRITDGIEVNKGVCMKRNWVGSLAAAIASMGMILPSVSLAGAPAAGSHDIALRDGGVLVGQVVNQQGVAKANAAVSIRYASHEVVRTTTDENGVFAAKGLRGGQYQLLTDDGVSTCRLWAADTAPPAARPAALVVSGDNVVRGQGYGHGWISWMKAHPYLTAGTATAAVAIPVAIASSDDDDNGS
jgi:hypothetical protein